MFDKMISNIGVTYNATQSLDSLKYSPLQQRKLGGKEMTHSTALTTYWEKD